MISPSVTHIVKTIRDVHLGSEMIAVLRLVAPKKAPKPMLKAIDSLVHDIQGLLLTPSDDVQNIEKYIYKISKLLFGNRDLYHLIQKYPNPNERIRLLEEHKNMVCWNLVKLFFVKALAIVDSDIDIANEFEQSKTIEELIGAIAPVIEYLRFTITGQIHQQQAALEIRDTMAIREIIEKLNRLNTVLSKRKEFIQHLAKGYDGS